MMQPIQLGKLIDYERPVHAIQAGSLDGIEPPGDSIDEMAADDLKLSGRYLGHAAC